MKTLFNQVRLEARLFLRRKDELFWTLAFPMFFVGLFGAIFANSEWAPGMRAIDHLVPSILIMALMVTGMMNNAVSFAQERESGIYRRLALTPLTRQKLIGSQILYRYLISLVQAVLLMAVGLLAFKVKMNGNYALFWLVITLGSLCFLSIGFALTGLIKTARSATPIVMSVYFVMMFLGGLFFPSDVMPQFMKSFSSALPTTHLNTALRMVALQDASLIDIWKELAVAGAWLVGCLGISVKFFRWE